MNKYKILLASAEILCKPNSILSSQIYNYLVSNNHQIVTDISDADYIIVNSCGFNSFREEYSVYLINKFLNVEDGPRVIVVGCLIKINRDAISKFKNIIVVENLEELDRIFLNSNPYDKKDASLNGKNFKYLNSLPENVRAYNIMFNLKLNIFKFIYKLFSFFKISSGPIKTIIEEENPEKNFYVQISTGCLGNCSYCIIKKSKGNLISRPIEEILEDIENNYNQIMEKNIYLVADDCGCYGKDINTNLWTLIQRISKKYRSIKIDICYINPKWINKDFENYLLMFKTNKINSVNIPIQSGSKRILEKMNRKMNISKFYSNLTKIRRKSPETIFWTHYLVGFPGETWKDFLQSQYSIRYYDHAYVFSYTDRPGTKGATLKNKISKKTKFLRERLLGGIVTLMIIWNLMKNIVNRKRLKS